VDRCALFVDAGYVLGDGAMAVHGTRNRESVSWDYAGVLEVLRNVARDHTGLPLLRCYWYEATVEGRRSSEHEILADLPGVKLRLGKLQPGRREGAQGEIHRDLTTLARNRAISDALVVSAEDGLAQVIAEVQDLGLRVILVHIAAPGWTAAAALRQECDEIVEISEAHLRPSVELVVGAEPVSEEDREVVPAYASRASANGHGTPGVIGQPSLPVGSHAAPPGLYTGPVIAQYQRAAQPADSHRPPLADASGPAVAGNHSLTAPPGPQPGMAPPPGAVGQPGTGQAGPPAPRDVSAQPSPPALPAQPGSPGPVGLPGPAAPPSALAGPPALPTREASPGHHAAPPGHHAAPAHRAAGPRQHAAPSQPMIPPGQPAPGHGAQPAPGHAAQPAPGHAAQPAPGHAAQPAPGHAAQPAPGHAAAHISGPLTAPPPAAPPPAAPPPAAPPQHAQPLPRGGQHAAPPSQHAEPGPALGQHAQHGLPSQQFAPGQPMAGPAMPGQPVPGQPGAPAAPPGFQAPAGLPPAQAAPARQGMPAYQAAPPPPPPPPAPAPLAALPPTGYSAQAAAAAPGQAVPRPPTQGAPPGPSLAPPPGAVPAAPVAQPGQQPRGTGYPAALPGRPPAVAGDQHARQFPVAPGQPNTAMPAPYIPPQGPHSGPQPAAQHALVPQPVAVSLADAVQAAHGEGFNFGQGVARDAPALWLEAVLARKPRMPSDLEARLLQDSSLPIDSLLHDEVRHALRRGFWDALERVRH
jgi:hypothetical protein